MFKNYLSFKNYISRFKSFICLLPFALSPAVFAGDLVFVEVINNNTNSPVRIDEQGNKKLITVAPNSLYSIRLTNNTTERLLAAVAVDGRAVVESPGLVLAPQESVNINSRPQDSTPGFRFSAPAQSLTSRLINNPRPGTLTVSVFRERADSQPNNYLQSLYPRPVNTAFNKSTARPVETTIINYNLGSSQSARNTLRDLRSLLPARTPTPDASPQPVATGYYRDPLPPSQDPLLESMSPHR